MPLGASIDTIDFMCVRLFVTRFAYVLEFRIYSEFTWYAIFIGFTFIQMNEPDKPWGY